MRALFVALAAAAAAAVAAVVVAPRLVDGRAVQAELRRLVQEATGRDLVVHGRVGLDVFPRLELRLAQVEVGGPPAAGEAPRIAADRVDLQISPLALLTGRLEVRRARVVRPRVTLAAGTPPDLLAAAAEGLSRPGLAGLATIQVADGRVELVAARETPPYASVEGLDGVLRRNALLRRIEASLTGSSGGAPLELRAEFGEAPAAGADGTIPPRSLALDLAYGPSGRQAKLEFRGFGTPPDAGAGAAPTLKGQLGLDAADAAALYRLAALVAPLPPPPAPLPRAAPILLDGQADLADGTLRLSEVTARLGANTLTADAELGLAGRPRLKLRIEAGELAAGTDVGDDLAPLVATPWWASAGLEGEAELRFGLVRWREAPIRTVRAELAFAADGLRVERLSAGLPGAADLSIEGVIGAGTGGGTRFVGRLSLSAEDARATLASLGAPLPASVPGGGLRATSLTSGLVAGRSSVALRDFELRLDGSRITGSAAMVPGVRPRLAVSAAADRLDLSLYLPPLEAVSAPWLRERLTGLDAAVDLSAGRVGLGGLWAEGAYLRASLEQGLAKLAELSLRDLAETRLRLAGSADLPVESFQLAGDLVAERPTRLLRALGIEAPPAAARFAPARVAGTARGSFGSTEVEVELDTAGFDAGLAASLGPWFAPRDGASATFKAGADRLDEALRNLGLLAGDRPGLARPFRLAGRIGRSEEGYDVSFDAEAPPSRIGSSLRVGPAIGGTADGAEPATLVSGRVEAETIDHDLLVGAIELAAPWTSAWQPSSWLGRLPETPVALGRLRRVDADVTAEARRLVGFGAAAAQATAGGRLRVSGGGITLDDLRLPLAGGTLTGTLALIAAPAFATLGADLDLAGCRAERVLELLGVPPALTGELRLDAKLAASGRTVAGLVQGLEGEAELRLTDGTLPSAAVAEGASGAAPVAVAAAVPFEALGGDLTVARGIAASAPPGLGLVLPNGREGTVALRLDLAAWMAEIGVDLALPGGAGIAERRLLGPPGALRVIPPEPAPEPQPPAEPAAVGGDPL